MPEIFYIEPAGGRAMWFFAALIALMLVLTACFAWFLFASRSASFELSDDGLRIRSAMYGRTIPAAALVADEARIVDLRREMQPTMRTNGIGMPGYSAGWFRLRSERRALLFVTDRSRVVYVPTREGYPVLLSVREPERFLEALRRRARAPVDVHS